jgi:26S proteasome regulatory subunit N5
VLAPYDNEQADLTHRVLEDKLLEEIPVYRWVQIGSDILKI